MRNIQEISKKIDDLSLKCCRKLSKEEKEKFFEACKVKRYYIKGKRKGQERDIYEVNGIIFNKLWKEIYPYVVVSCNKSNYYNFSEVDDAVSEVKYTLFYALQRFGPVFNNQSLSQRLSLIVNISLTNQYNKKMRYVQFSSIEDFNDDTGCNIDFEDLENNMKYIDFWCDIPTMLREGVERIISGEKIRDVERSYEISNFRKVLKSFL